jgi:formate dehydrogenase subunit gamma
VHWVHASAFLVLLGTGLCLYLPSLAEVVGRRRLVKTIHLYTALAWAVALVLVFVLGDRRTLLQTAREIDRFDANDRAWLRRQPAPQGRLNAGQKLNAIVTAAFALLFALSGVFLWVGERNTRFRLPQALLVHDWLMDVSLVLFAGHLFLAGCYPRTRHALSGITRGYVDEAWALEHHRTWAEGLVRLREADAVLDGRSHALDAGPELLDESLRTGRSAGFGGRIAGR